MAHFNLLFAARFDEATATMLQTLCSKRRMSRSAVLRSAVRDSFVAVDAVGTGPDLSPIACGQHAQGDEERARMETREGSAVRYNRAGRPTLTEQSVTALVTAKRQR